MTSLTKGNHLVKLLLKSINNQLSNRHVLSVCAFGITTINKNIIHDDSKNKNLTLNPNKFNRVNINK